MEHSQDEAPAGLARREDARESLMERLMEKWGDWTRMRTARSATSSGMRTGRKASPTTMSGGANGETKDDTFDPVVDGR